MISKQGRKQVKEFICNLRGNTCSICGNTHSPAVFDFHHLQPKKFGISAYIKKHITTKFRITQELMDEVDKCIMVCANCHREIHSGQ